MSHGAGIGLRLLATALFSLMSTCVRAASFTAPVGQILFWRSWVALLPIILYLAWQRDFPSGLRTARPWGHLHRCLYGCLATFLSFLSLAHLPLASATALSFLAPLMVVPAAILLLGERPGLVVGVAVVLGFLGVILMLAPAATGPEPDLSTMIGVAAGLGMAATTAAAKIQIKSLTATEKPGTIAFYFALVCSLAGLATRPFGWSEPTPTALLWLIGAGLAGGLAHIAMTEAVARAPVSTLAPFEYTSMIWALLLDLVVFGLMPEALGLAGALLIIVAAGMVAMGDRLPIPLRRRASLGR